MDSNNKIKFSQFYQELFLISDESVMHPRRHVERVILEMYKAGIKIEELDFRRITTARLISMVHQKIYIDKLIISSWEVHSIISVLCKLYAKKPHLVPYYEIARRTIPYLTKARLRFHNSDKKDFNALQDKSVMVKELHNTAGVAERGYEYYVVEYNNCKLIIAGDNLIIDNSIE